MAIKARIKLPYIPWDKEYKLINEGGFSIYSRKRHEFIIFEKEVPKKSSNNFEVLVNGELEAKVQLNLRRRCSSILSLYGDDPKDVKVRLENVAATLPKHQSKFVNNWIIENLDTDEVVVLKRSKA